MSLLGKIKNKSEAEKKFIALVGALVLTLFIVGIWWSSGDTGNKEANAAGDTLSSISPFATIKEEIGKIFTTTRENTEKFTEQASQAIADLNQSTSTEATSTPADMSDLSGELKDSLKILEATDTNPIIK
ncbi:MAG: hypothetical protein WCO10_00830 [bacterium]